MAVGRPISLTPNIATKTISIVATAGQTSFTPAGGYRINELAVYRNGVRLVQGSDFTARDGATVTLISAATVNDVIDFQIFDSFNVVAAVDPNNAVDLGGDLTVTGSGTSITGIDLYATGNTNISGIVTATSYYGSGANLTDVISGVEIKLSGTSVGTAATVLNFGPGFSTATPVSAGISTIETTRTLTLGVRTGTAVTFSISGGSFNVSARSGNVAIDV